jgi:hypothetical protein
MKKVLKITESQYNRIFLLNEQKPDHLMPGSPDYPGTDMYKEIHKNDREALEGLKSLGKLIYDVFDCSTIKPKEDEDKSWLDYGHCIVDNISMAVSVVPVIGTIASGVFDLLNSAVYLGEAAVSSISGDFKEAGMSLGFAGLSALGIIPGVTEVKALGKVSKGVIKNTDNILKELSEQGIKKGSKKAEDIKKVNQVIEKYSKGMSTSEKKQLGEVLDLLGNPKVKEGIKNMGKFNDFTQNFMKSTGLKNYQLRTLIGSKDFNKILKNNGGDIYKALNSNESKKLISNIIAQGVSVVAVIGFSKWLENKVETLKKTGMSEKDIKVFEDNISKKTKNLTDLQKEQAAMNYDSEVREYAEENGISIAEAEKQIAQESIVVKDFFIDLLSDKPENTHTIQKGENLSTIAKKYGMKWTDLYDKNKDIISKTQKKYGGVKTCNKPYCKGRETPSPEYIYKGTTLKI